MFKSKSFYLYTSLGMGTYWKRTGMEQGMTDFKLNFISPLFQIWGVKARQFIKMNYTIGINRYDIENLLLLNSDGIRGFGSQIEKGKQRLTRRLLPRVRQLARGPIVAEEYVGDPVAFGSR